MQISPFNAKARTWSHRLYAYIHTYIHTYHIISYHIMTMRIFYTYIFIMMMYMFPLSTTFNNILHRDIYIIYIYVYIFYSVDSCHHLHHQRPPLNVSSFTFHVAHQDDELRDAGGHADQQDQQRSDDLWRSERDDEKTTGTAQGGGGSFTDRTRKRRGEFL